jgi:hypothetical protein
MKKNNKNNLISISPPASPASIASVLEPKNIILPSVSDEKSSIIPPAPPVTLASPIVSIIPVKIYSNSDTCKAQILSDNKNQSGIYMWKNQINGKRYIGSSNNLNRRFSEYFNANYLLKNNSMHICNSLNKHGYTNFSLSILEYCSPDKCLIREKYF